MDIKSNIIKKYNNKDIKFFSKNFIFIISKYY